MGYLLCFALHRVSPCSIAAGGCLNSQDVPVYRCWVYIRWGSARDPVQQAAHMAGSRATDQTNHIQGVKTFIKLGRCFLNFTLSVCHVPYLKGKSLHNLPWVSQLYCRLHPMAFHDPHWSKNNSHTHTKTSQRFPQNRVGQNVNYKD